MYLGPCFAWKLTANEAHCCKVIEEEKETHLRIWKRGKGHKFYSVEDSLAFPSHLQNTETHRFQSPLGSLPTLMLIIKVSLKETIGLVRSPFFLWKIYVELEAQIKATTGFEIKHPADDAQEQ